MNGIGRAVGRRERVMAIEWDARERSHPARCASWLIRSSPIVIAGRVKIMAMVKRGIAASLFLIPIASVWAESPYM
jgi:hypothetical protein